MVNLSDVVAILVVVHFNLLSAQRYECGSAYECVNFTLDTTSTGGYSSYEDIYATGYKSLFGRHTSGLSNNDVYCKAAYACSETAILYSTDGVLCRGEHSCSYCSEIYNEAQNGRCYGACACTHSTFTQNHNQNFQCMADQSCSFTRFNETAEFFVYGAYSLMNGHINSHPSETMTIDLYGCYAGYNLTVYCDSGHTCNLNCYGNACLNTLVICIDNCNLNVVCDSSECEYNPIVVNDTAVADSMYVFFCAFS